MIKAILFDLDGTLLPMDQDYFIETYLKGLAAKLAPYGYDPETFMKGMWAGVKAMILNDGTKTNEETFWAVFCDIVGKNARADEPIFDEFYRTKFQEYKSLCGFNEKAAQTVNLLKEKGYRVALATNPLFPSIATESRIRWAGFEPLDFEFFTTYENSRNCKPNPDYYKDVAAKLGLDPAECLMVGNDVRDDMIAEKLGMKVFLLTDCLINKKEIDISALPQGSYKELLEYIDTI